MARDDGADGRASASWFDGLGDAVRSASTRVLERVDRLDDEFDRFARRALGDDDDDGSARDVEFTADDAQAMREALAATRAELLAREEALEEARRAAAAATAAAAAARDELDGVRARAAALEGAGAGVEEATRPGATVGGRGGKKKGRRGGGRGGAANARESTADDARGDTARAEIEALEAEVETLRAVIAERDDAMARSAKERVDELERARAEAGTARESASADARAIQDAETRADAAEARVKALEDAVDEATSSMETLRAELREARDAAKKAESRAESLRDELTDAVAAREDAEAAVSRGAVNAASANSKTAAAEKAKVKAEAELAELRKQLELMDATGREAASSIAARERAELAQQRAESKLALAEKEAEEARAQSEKALREGEERKRRFAHVQSQFQVTEKELKEKLEKFESELNTLRANADEAEKMKAEAISIVEEAHAESVEVKKALASMTSKADELERALRSVEAEASESRTQIGVLEETLALRSAPPVSEPHPEVPKRSASTQTDREVERETPPLVARDDSLVRDRLLAIMATLNIPTQNANAQRPERGAFGMSLITGLFAGSDDDEGKASVDSAATDETDLDALLHRVETWARERRGETPTTSSPRDAPSVDPVAMEKEIQTLKDELAALKADEGERSTASLAAVNRRAQEAERAAAEAKEKLAPLERENRELAWQIAMLSEQDESKTRPALAQSGWLTQAIKGCTAPRRPRSVLL